MALSFNTKLTTAQLLEYVRNFKFTRRVTQWHIHHTYKPDYKDFNGSNHETLNTNMKSYHINTNGWSDIGQHLTLYPDGVWLIGRDLNKDPASILGWNTGAICVETIGNFDTGADKLTQKQQDALYEVTEFMVEVMKLEPHFHRDSPTAGKTCPGSGIDRETFFKNALAFTENKQAEIAKANADLIAQQQAEALAKSKVEALKAQMAKVNTVFVDMILPNGDGHWATKYVQFLYDKKIVAGTTDKDGNKVFKPNEPITRAEAATLICKTYESIMERIEAIIRDNNLK